MSNLETVSIQGERSHMEDCYFFDTNFGDKGLIFAGIYDGHGGYKAAEYASKHLHEYFLNLTKTLSPQEAFTRAYDRISNEIGNEDGGTCAIDFLIKNNKIFFANVGDCRLIVIGKETKQLSIDHRVKNTEEADRIKKLGGLIRGPYVFTGFSGLMVTRSLGDQKHKPVGVISTPYVGSYNIQLDDQYIIAGTDGLFDVVDNEKVAIIAKSIKDPKKIGEALKDVAIANKSRDNITVMVYKL